ncbi:MAG: hypothetical protein PHQ23_12125, partial [Candidatus Wallbacteria bacterium]|nr:hypothetical protein [Candidatus Wallbacteria bacterium]
MSGSLIGIIDFGSNSTRLLLTRRDNIFSPVKEQVTVTRLSEGAFLNRQLQKAPMERTMSAALEYLAECRDRKAAVYSFGTSILREAVNSADFLALARLSGLEIEIISGNDEARYNSLAVRECFSSLDPFLACDLGGGSAELIYCNCGKSILDSLPVGCVRYLRDWEEGRHEFIRDNVRNLYNAG